MSKSVRKLWFGIRGSVRQLLEGLRARSVHCLGITTKPVAVLAFFEAIILSLSREYHVEGKDPSLSCYCLYFSYYSPTPVCFKINEFCQIISLSPLTPFLLPRKTTGEKMLASLFAV